jgi:hypothetical protein
MVYCKGRKTNFSVIFCSNNNENSSTFSMENNFMLQIKLSGKIII